MAIATDAVTFGDLLKSAKNPKSEATPEPVPRRYGPKPPAGKRTMSYARNLAKAESAVKSGDIQPSVRQIRALCSCGQSTATSIRAELIRRGLAESDSSGRMSTA